MTQIIASFNQRSAASSALRALRHAGFELSPQMPLPIDPEFDVSPDAAVSPGAEESGTTAVGGAAIGATVGIITGLTLTPFLGPIGPLAGAGVGAYAGSLVGALAGLEESQDDVEGEPGALLELEVSDESGKARATEILNAHGAVSVSEA